VEKRDAVLPDWEVVVRGTNGVEVMVVGFFIDERDEVAVLVGVEAENLVPPLLLVLESTKRVLEARSTWVGKDDLQAQDIKRASENGDLPF